MKKIKSIIIVLIILLVICLIILGINLFFKNNSSDESENVANEQIVKDPDFWNVQIVKNSNDFYTASSCVDKFLSLWYMKDTENVYKILEDEYKQENLITEENLFEKIGTLQNSLIFRPKKMYFSNIEQSIQRYYVYGTVRPDVMNGRGEEQDYYVEVILNFNNETFSIRPSTSEEFPDNI